MSEFTIFDYLDWRGDLSFDKSPFNDIDAAILARFSYEPFEGIVPEAYRRTVTLEKACFKLLADPELNDKVLYDDDMILIRKMYESERFKHIKLSGYVNTIDLEEESQFSAVVYDLGEMVYFLAFRGTDDNLVSWKEDLNMGFEFPIMAQTLASKYLINATKRIKEGSFYVGGHSKGGNLSIYSSAYVDDETKKRIISVYNFDGPGFTEDILNTPEFLSVKDKVITYVPKFSIVGMILEHITEYSVVKSRNSAIMQHEILSWLLTRDGFVTLEKVDPKSVFLDNTLTHWLSQLERKEREEFVDALYQILTGGEDLTLTDLSEKKFESVLSVVKNYQSTDDNTKKRIKETLKILVRSAKNVHKKKK